MGGKLIWQLYVDKNHPVSKIFRMKYLKDVSLRNLTTSNTLTGTTIWNYCRRGINKFNQQLYRIPGNGKRILLWEDKISGNPPLFSVILLEEIKNWLTNKGLLRLDDICSWDSVGNWAGWSFLKLPDRLSSQKNCCSPLFLVLLQFIAPIKTNGVGKNMELTQLQKFSLNYKLHIPLVFPLQSGNQFGLLTIFPR